MQSAAPASRHTLKEVILNNKQRETLQCGSHTMTYKGYTAEISIDEEAGILFVIIAGIHDVITFQGETVAEFIQAFHDSVDDYLEWCAERGEEPQVPRNAAARAS
jgi:hypothetical protein